MILSKLQNDPKRMTSMAMAFIAIGLSLITIGITWPKSSPLLAHAGTDWNDFVRGAIETGYRFDRICPCSFIRSIWRASANRHAATRLILPGYIAAFGLLY
jgi:hypothetical protein